MKILIDTHVWIWAMEKPEELGNHSTRLLENEETEILISPISTLEIAQLISSGKIGLNQTLGSWINKSVLNLKAGTVPFTHEIAEAAYQMREPFHKDPADRILVATAALENIALMTADERILGYKHIRTLDARK
jgi:PIN domain nuclease of toxin-antitoxin system